METAAGAAAAAAARGVSLPIPSSQRSRKEWRAVSEHSSRNTVNKDVERSKLGQSDERTIYEQGREPAEVDFCSITIDESSDNNILQQRLHDVASRREDLQDLEIELQAHVIARSEIIEMQKSFDARFKEQANAKLQEQLLEMERTIHELERKMEKKERELQAIQLANEAAWAKEDLLREQSKELQTFRREQDISQAERAQHLKQIDDLQEHFQAKERQYLELHEQHRVAKETILFKDEQLGEAQAWIAHIQEMDALQSTTNHSLQVELWECTEKYNQLWISCQQQFTEMGRLYLRTIQQLQLELADARERSDSFPEESHVFQIKSKDASQLGQTNGSQVDVDASGTPEGNSGALPNGNAENVSSLVSSSNSSSQADHVHGVPIAPSSLLGMPTYLPPGQVTALDPFVMHHQGVHHPVQSHVAQSHVGHFYSVPAMSPLKQWQNQQAVSKASQVPNPYESPSSRTEQNLMRSDVNYGYDVSANGQAVHAEFLGSQESQGMEPNSSVQASAEVLDLVDNRYLVSSRAPQCLQHVTSPFNDSLRLVPLSWHEAKEMGTNTLAKCELESKVFMTEQATSTANVLSSETPSNPLNFGETTVNNTTGAVPSEVFVSSGQNSSHAAGKDPEISLLDERSLLTCIFCTIPPGSGGRIRISSSLPNRLGKMLAPLHWHDYKKKYGKLDDFVASHTELFVIEGDYIQLREGAQEIIAATAAVAKVAATAAKTLSSTNSSLLPSVAVTAMAQSHLLKRTPSIDPNAASANATLDSTYQLLTMQSQHTNGVSLNAGGISNVKILSKPQDPQLLNGPQSRLDQSFGLLTIRNGVNSKRSALVSALSKGSTQGRLGTSFAGKQQARTTGVATASRRWT